VGSDLSVYFVAGVALAALIVIMRWVFGSSRPSTGRPEHGPDANLGMLRPVLASTSLGKALDAKRALTAKGIRCSMSRIDHEHYDVLVFATDLSRARSELES